jgi:hypothetical protein
MARSRSRWLIAALWAILVVVLVFVGLAAVVGPGRAIYWAINLVIPMVVILVVVLGTVGLLVREGGRALDSDGGRVLDHSDKPPSPTFRRAPQRGEGFSRGVYRLLVSLFLLAGVAMTYFFWLVIRDQWIHDRLLVAERFDSADTMRILFALLASVAVPSGLLWRHYRRIDSYGSPLEPFFMVVFTLCVALAAVVVLPVLFAG